jgi:Zn-dependent protease with chaperone function
VPVVIIAYPVLAFFVGNLLAARPRAQQIKKAGRQAKVMGNNYPEIHRVLVRQAGLIGLPRTPDMYLVPDDMPLIYSLPGGPGTIIASTALLQAVNTDEFHVLLAHEIAHIRSQHVRVEAAMVFIRNANIALKIALFPVLLMTLFARAWCDLIEFTADRGALLITLRPAMVNSALVKLSVAADPNAGITRDELQAFLDSAGDIQTDAAQLERHFKVGKFISTQPGLRERIEQLTEFPRSEQGAAAIAKMAEIQGVSPGDIPHYKASEVGTGVEQIQDAEE